jgi:2-polyprenyl-3-methyl-5-hydroxy-6-metoxy-1,4-benzoquinol methylase
MNDLNFPPCAICGGTAWSLVHSGSIRNGTHISSLEAQVCRCNQCGIDRLDERSCLTHSAYESGEYRSHLAQDHDTTKHFASHDELARFTLETLWPHSLRRKTVADVGCGGGALLDHIVGVAGLLIAIEPSIPWSESLIKRGYKWYPGSKEAAADFKGQVDVVLSTQVIEHVENPREFLADIGSLLTTEGFAVISTPNRADVLMELLPNAFPQFFYRSQHRWAFDAESLRKCAIYAGLTVMEIRHVHRYGLANALHWLKDGRPFGRTGMPPLDSTIDRHWQAWLESKGMSDNLYMFVSRKR